MEELNLNHNFLLNVIRNDFHVSSAGCSCDKLDWNELFQLARKHRIFPRFYQSVKEIIPDAFKEMYSVQNQHYHNKVDAMLTALQDLFFMSKADKVRFLLIKGLPLSVTIYNDIYARQINDIDILVAADDVYRMDYALRKNGYVEPYKSDWRNGQFSLLPFTTLHQKHSKHQYEYIKFGENISKVELHNYLPHFQPFMADILWNTVGVMVDGCLYNTLDLEHMCLYLFINAYSASETFDALQKKALLRDYIDIYECLKKFKSTINWERFYGLIDKYGFGQKYNLMLNNLTCLYQNNPTIAAVMDIDKQYNKEKEILPCNIEMDFIRRMLLPELRKKLAISKLKECVCTPQKWLNPINIYPYEHECGSDEMEVCDCDINVMIKYCLNYSRDGLYITIVLDDQLYRDLDKYMISFTLLNNDPENCILYSLFEIMMEDNRIEILKKDYQSHHRSYIFDMNDGESNLTSGIDSVKNRIKFFVPFSAIGSNPFVRKCDLAGQVELYKNIYKSIYHIVNRKVQDVFEARVLRFIE